MDAAGEGARFQARPRVGLKDALTTETKALLGEGPDKRNEALLITQLGHVDARVRLDAQLELVRRGADGPLVELATQSKASPRARLHAIWALGQRLRGATGDAAGPLARTLIVLLEDPDAEIRAQSAKVLGDAKIASAYDALVRLLRDRAPRPQFFAAVALGRLADRRAFTPAVALLRANADRDPYLRHAAVMALVGSADVGGLVALAKDRSVGVRRGALVTLRRLRRPEVKVFLDDADPLVARDAAEAINDSGLDEALPALAGKTALALRDAPIGLRVVNALFRQGNKDGALALAALAANEKAITPVREAALRALGDFPKPSIRDRVTGLYHPVKKSDDRVGVAESALLAQLPKLLGATPTPDGVRVAAAKAAGLLKLSGSSPGIAAAIGRKGIAATARAELLRMLVALGGPEVPSALKAASKDIDPAVRSDALRLQIATAPNEALPLFENAVTKGTVAEKQAALRSVAGLPAGRTDELMVQLLDAYVAGKFVPEAGLELLEGAGHRKAESVAAALKRVEGARPQDDLGAYREALVGGDAEAGRKVFFGHQQVQCLRCHKINGTGGDVGPDLSHAARNQKATYLLEAIAKPGAQFAKGFESVVLTMNDGSIHAGTVVKDDATAVQILNPDNVAEKLNKADIKKREAGASGMPDGFADILTRRELRDLVAFLATLK